MIYLHMALCISNKYEHSVCLICGCVVEGPHTRIETAVLLPVLS